VVGTTRRMKFNIGDKVRLGSHGILTKCIADRATTALGRNIYLLEGCSLVWQPEEKLDRCPPPPKFKLGQWVQIGGQEGHAFKIKAVTFNSQLGFVYTIPDGCSFAEDRLCAIF
jgi:hypothetical protein